MGRPRNGRKRVEDATALRIIDVLPLRRPEFGFRMSGVLTAFDPATGRALASIAYEGEARGGWGRLSLVHTPAGQRWAEPAYLVALVASDHPFGPRFRFRCPDGGGLTSTLYLPPGAERFASRVAHRLAFASEAMTARQRAEARARRIRLDLGSSADLAAPFPERPRGMHRATYERRRAEAFGAEAHRRRVQGVTPDPDRSHATSAVS